MDSASVRHRLNPTTWIVWTSAGVLAALLIRNPWYLIALSAVALIVGWRATGEAPGRSTFLLVLGVVATSTVINFVFSRAGATVLFQAPLPYLGGPYTLEGLLFGLSAGIQVATLLLVMSVFAKVVTAADLLRRTPRGLYPIGVAAAIGINFAPQARQAYIDLREASRLRIRPNGWRQTPRILTPLVFEAVDRAMAQAESLAARGWASSDETAPRRWPVALAWTALGASILLCAAAPDRAVLAAALLGIALLVQRWLSKSSSAPETHRVERWTSADTAVAGLAIGSITALILMSALNLGALVYYPYPTATLPGWEIGPLAAVAALLGPVGVGRT
jgi:energy-coupling factor transport system permease protein